MSKNCCLYWLSAVTAGTFSHFSPALYLMIRQMRTGTTWTLAREIKYGPQMLSLQWPGGTSPDKVILSTVSCWDLFDLYGTAHSLYSVAGDKADKVKLRFALHWRHGWSWNPVTVRRLANLGFNPSLQEKAFVGFFMLAFRSFILP